MRSRQTIARLSINQQNQIKRRISPAIKIQSTLVDAHFSIKTGLLLKKKRAIILSSCLVKEKLNQLLSLMKNTTIVEFAYQKMSSIIFYRKQNRNQSCLIPLKTDKTADNYLSSLLIFKQSQFYNNQPMSQRVAQLSKTLYLTHRQQTKHSELWHQKSRIEVDRLDSKNKYESLTNRSKDGQKQLVNQHKSKRKPQWRHDHYKTNQTFSLFKLKEMDAFPNNNAKYNVQFLDRSLYGASFKIPLQQVGFFSKPKDKLYSNHFKPILKQKRNFNENYQIRQSLFGQTWVDEKAEDILDEYKIQANPFRTPASNNLISTMRKDRNRIKLV